MPDIRDMRRRRLNSLLFITQIYHIDQLSKARPYQIYGQKTTEEEIT